MRTAQPFHAEGLGGGRQANVRGEIPRQPGACSRGTPFPSLPKAALAPLRPRSLTAKQTSASPFVFYQEDEANADAVGPEIANMTNDGT